MFSGQNSWQDADRGYQMSPEDFQTLAQLAGKYGPINLMFFIRSIGETCAFSLCSPLTQWHCVYYS